MMKLFIFLALFASVNALETAEERFDRLEASIAELQESMQELLKPMKTTTSGTTEIQNDVSIATGEPLDVQKMNDTELEERVQILEFLMGNVQKDVNIVPGKPSDNQKMNNTELEERVQILEFQMGNVQEDLDDLDIEVTDLESEVSNVAGQVTVLLEGQLGQDERLLNLEDETDVLQTDITSVQASVNELDTTITTLNETNSALEDSLNILDTMVDELQMNGTELDSRLDELESLDIGTELGNLDSRLNDLELDGTVAFHVGFLNNPVIPIAAVAVWDEIGINLGDGYNSFTGEFVVPSGGAGLYYFNAAFLFDNGEAHYMYIRHNGDYLCLAYEDKSGSGDYGGASCGAVVELAEGDTVDVVHQSGADASPCLGTNNRSTFSGFRIAPQY